MVAFGDALTADLDAPLSEQTGLDRDEFMVVPVDHLDAVAALGERQQCGDGTVRTPSRLSAVNATFAVDAPVAGSAAASSGVTVTRSSVVSSVLPSGLPGETIDSTAVTLPVVLVPSGSVTPTAVPTTA